MCNWFNILLLLIQVSRCTEKIDWKTIHSVKGVLHCPTTKVGWGSAAKRKQCGKLSAKENFTATGKRREYHCVINPFLNETLEVCARPKTIIGFCAEFNVAGGVIQNNEEAPCNKTFPKCDAIYISTEAYKYPDCYEIVYKSRNSKTTTTIDPTQEEPGHWKEKTAFFAATVAVFVICCLVLSAWLIKRTKIQTTTQHEDAREMESLMSTGPESRECIEINETINRLTAMPEDITSQDGIIEESSENLFEPPGNNNDVFRRRFLSDDVYSHYLSRPPTRRRRFFLDDEYSHFTSRPLTGRKRFFLDDFYSSFTSRPPKGRKRFFLDDFYSSFTSRPPKPFKINMMILSMACSVTTLYRSVFRTSEMYRPSDFSIEITSVRNVFMPHDYYVLAIALFFILYFIRNHGKLWCEDMPPSSDSKDLIEEQLPLD